MYASTRDVDCWVAFVKQQEYMYMTSLHVLACIIRIVFIVYECTYYLITYTLAVQSNNYFPNAYEYTCVVIKVYV